ncbi:MAG: hypothetical protein PHU12_02705 [Candidatus Aenigmarchaeota archaeon]|nr:hypothetical protein [Candidatus Aenigmarchaeota archaeon]
MTDMVKFDRQRLKPPFNDIGTAIDYIRCPDCKKIVAAHIMRDGTHDFYLRRTDEYEVIRS